jgi:hypothetical protein
VSLLGYIRSDVLSFYKEELAGETENLIPTLASLYKESKGEIVKKLLNEAVESHFQILDTLHSSAEAVEARNSFANGYVEFHFALSKRYRLTELDINIQVDDRPAPKIAVPPLVT